MGFLDDLSKVASGVAQTAKGVAGDIAEKTADLASDIAEKGKLQAEILKLKRQITVEQKRMSESESELGKLAYRNVIDEETNDLAPACEKIRVHLMVITQLEQKLDDLKNQFPEEVAKAEAKVAEVVNSPSAEELEDEQIIQELEQRAKELQDTPSDNN